MHPQNLHSLTVLARSIAAKITEIANNTHVRVLLHGLDSEATRAGWVWKEGLSQLLPLHQNIAPESTVLAWEGGVCAFFPTFPLACALAPTPHTPHQRSQCPGLGRLPQVLSSPGPDITHIPEIHGIFLPHPHTSAASAHTRLLWSQFLGNLSPHILQHPLLQDGLHLRRTENILAAFSPIDPWPLALFKI